MARLVNSLPTQTEMQRGLSGQITEAARSLSQLRLLLFAQSGHSIPALFLVILVFWLAIMFASFRLFGSMNTTLLAFTFLFAVSAAGAIFLIYELIVLSLECSKFRQPLCWMTWIVAARVNIAWESMSVYPGQTQKLGRATG
jgi:hypothetical protein